MLKRNLFFTFSIMIFALASFVLDTFNYNPYQANQKVFINFYLSFGIAVAMMATLVVYYFKFRHYKGEIVYKLFWPSFRQGVLIALAMTLLLMLQGLRLLDAWVGISVITVIMLFELFFQTKRSTLFNQTAHDKQREP